MCLAYEPKRALCFFIVFPSSQIAWAEKKLCFGVNFKRFLFMMWYYNSIPFQLPPPPFFFYTPRDFCFFTEIFSTFSAHSSLNTPERHSTWRTHMVNDTAHLSISRSTFNSVYWLLFITSLHLDCLRAVVFLTAYHRKTLSVSLNLWLPFRTVCDRSTALQPQWRWKMMNVSSLFLS